MAPRLIAAGMRPLLPPLLPSTKTSSPHRFRQDRRILLLASSCSLPPPPYSALSPSLSHQQHRFPFPPSSTGCRCTALFRPISSPLPRPKSTSSLLLHFTFTRNSRQFLVSFLSVSLSLSLRPLNHRIRLIAYDARGNFRKNITFPRTIRSIPREKYNLFPSSHSDYRRAFSIPLPR